MAGHGAGEPREHPNAPESLRHEADFDPWSLSGDAPTKRQDEAWEREQREIDEEMALRMYGDPSDPLADPPNADVSSYYTYLLPDDAPQPPDLQGINRRTNAGKEAQQRYNNYARNYFRERRRTAEQPSDMAQPGSQSTRPRDEDQTDSANDSHQQPPGG